MQEGTEKERNRGKDMIKVGRKKAVEFADSIVYSKEDLVPVVVCDIANGEILMQRMRAGRQ